MTSYRFRVKLAADPTALSRDIVVGADRTLDEVQTTVNDAVGLDQGHHWFFGTDEDYWQSDVEFQSRDEYEESSGAGLLGGGPETYDAATVTVSELVDRLKLDVGDRICYLYDYGDEWRFYAILKETDETSASDVEPLVVNETGDRIEQYRSPEGR